MKKKFIKIFGALSAFILAVFGFVAYNNRNTRVPNLYGPLFIEPNLSTSSLISEYVGTDIPADETMQLIDFINTQNNSGKLSKQIKINITSGEKINPTAYYTITTSELNEFNCYDYVTITENPLENNN